MCKTPMRPYTQPDELWFTRENQPQNSPLRPECQRRASYQPEVEPQVKMHKEERAELIDSQVLHLRHSFIAPKVGPLTFHPT